PLGVERRRSLTIERLRLGIRSDQPVEIVLLKFVGVARQRGDIAHPKIARTAGKEIVKHEGGERRVSPGAAAADDGALRIDEAFAGQEPGAAAAILDLDDPPA